MTTLLKITRINNGLQSLKSFLQPTLETFTLPNRTKFLPTPRKRFPPWLIKPERANYKENLTKDNKAFINEVIRDTYNLDGTSPLKLPTIEPNVEWQPHYKRVGVIARKIGIVPMWMKDGKKVLTTMFQVADNHVIKYIPPEKYHPRISKRKTPTPNGVACMIVGADSANPQLFKKEYCGLFTEAGVMPKRLLTRFHISPEAALQPGTPLYATHFKPGQFIDIRGKTISRGFQGVMKRWGFSGMPASHGVTKTHRRGGNIGSGGNKARVMPGTKMPGHMGNRYRILRGVQVIRINTKYNVIWVLGQGSAGETNSLAMLYDTLLPTKSCKSLNTPPHFPTNIPQDGEELPEELQIDELHNFNDPTIMYKEES